MWNRLKTAPLIPPPEAACNQLSVYKDRCFKLRLFLIVFILLYIRPAVSDKKCNTGCSLIPKHATHVVQTGITALIKGKAALLHSVLSAPAPSWKVFRPFSPNPPNARAEPLTATGPDALSMQIDTAPRKLCHVLQDMPFTFPLTAIQKKLSLTR